MAKKAPPKFEWRTGSMFSANADKVGQELQTLKEVNIDTVLNMARNAKTELHKCFTWDDTLAAEKCRRQEASRVITCIAVRVEDVPTKGKTVIVRGYERVEVEEVGTRFAFTPNALKDKDYRNQILFNIHQDIAQLQHKLNVYQDIIDANTRAKIKALAAAV